MVVERFPDEVETYPMFVDGEATEASSGEWIDVDFPYNGETWARVPRGTGEDIDRAVSAARRCFESDEWQSMDGTDRGELLHAFADELQGHGDELARQGVLGNGKLLAELEGRVGVVSDWLRYFAGLADKVQGEYIPDDNEGMFVHTRPEPYGVVGAITPWNSPMTLATYKIAPAIATGNTVVLKPTEVNPVTTIRLAEIARDAGIPAGAVNVVTGYGDEAGVALSSHDGIDKLAFTGGTEAGRSVAAAAGRNIVPFTLELGGKSPNVVFEDADLDNALNGALRGIFSSTGQTCVAGSRLFLHESIHDEFVDRLVERAEEIRPGDPFEESTQIGPIACEPQYEKVKDYVQIAKDDGATLVTGGEPTGEYEQGLCFPPTVFTDVENDMRIAQEEVFGPVLAVLSFSDEEEVVAEANDVEYGLAAGVWTEDMGRAHRMMDALEAGVVWVNTYRKMSYTTPFGGKKASGIGRENGMEAVEEYVETKSVYLNTSGEVSNPFNPYDED
jgi:aldehyde dehydrogenase (NAD+)